jgi:hypothetical protein
MVHPIYNPSQKVIFVVRRTKFVHMTTLIVILEVTFSRLFLSFPMTYYIYYLPCGSYSNKLS